jgi:hypothetical protein
MRKIALLCLLLFTLPTLAQSPADAQSPSNEESKSAPADIHYYHLDIVVKELGEDGKVVNSRAYNATVSTDRGISTIRTGSRIPVNVTTKGGDIAYLDIGVNIDCGDVHETPQGVALSLTAEISSLATPVSAVNVSTPIIRQNKWHANTVLPLGKPTVVFSSDNVENKGRMQLEATATPLR